jgi:hypothetical protein
LPDEEHLTFEQACEEAYGYQDTAAAGEPAVTKTGKVLTDADVQALADEAEAGYDLFVGTEHAARRLEELKKTVAELGGPE